MVSIKGLFGVGQRKDASAKVEWTEWENRELGAMQLYGNHLADSLDAEFPGLPKKFLDHFQGLVSLEIEDQGAIRHYLLKNDVRELSSGRRAALTAAVSFYTRVIDQVEHPEKYENRDFYKRRLGHVVPVMKDVVTEISHLLSSMR